jgi:hypothetical protein
VTAELPGPANLKLWLDPRKLGLRASAVLLLLLVELVALSGLAAGAPSAAAAAAGSSTTPVTNPASELVVV